jgi:hypothetical protein
MRAHASCACACARVGVRVRATRVCVCESVSVGVSLSPSACACACARGCARVSAGVRGCAASAMRNVWCPCVFVLVFARAFGCVRWCVCARACACARVCSRAHARARAHACACVRSCARACVFCRSFGKHLRACVCVCACVCGATACVCLGAEWALWGPAVFIARPAAARARLRFGAIGFRCRARSAAGVTWTSRTTSAGWAGRLRHTSVVDAAGAIYVIGGTSNTVYKDVWVSTDGGARPYSVGGVVGGYTGWVLRGTWGVLWGTKGNSGILRGY